MRKISVILASLLLVAGVNASAQNLGSILGSLAGSSSSSDSKTSSVLGTLSKVIYSQVSNSSAVDLVGSWTYTGSAVELGSESTLSNIAGAAASSTVESKVDSYLENIGITSGSLKFTFNEDLTFSCTVKNIPVSGKWTYDAEAGTIKLQFGKALSFMNLSGTVSKTLNGCEMLFNGKTFLKFTKAILSYAAKQNSTASAVSSIAENYNDMKVGFNLKKN